MADGSDKEDKDTSSDHSVFKRNEGSRELVCTTHAPRIACPSGIKKLLSTNFLYR